MSNLWATVESQACSRKPSHCFHQPTKRPQVTVGSYCWTIVESLIPTDAEKTSYIIFGPSMDHWQTFALFLFINKVTLNNVRYYRWTIVESLTSTNAEKTSDFSVGPSLGHWYVFLCWQTSVLFLFTNKVNLCVTVGYYRWTIVGSLPSTNAKNV